MEKIRREDFFKKMAIITVGAAVAPKLISANSLFDKFISNSNNEQKAVINENAIIDLHCHPSLKMYLWDKHLWKCHNPGPGTNEIAMQDDVKQLSSGYVKGLVVAHYLLEASSEKEWNLLKNFFPLLKKVLPKLVDKIEHEDYSNFTQINIMIDTMESQMHLANQKQHKIQFVVARDFSEFEQALQDGNIPIAHAIEGAHALGRNFPISERRTKDPSVPKGKMANVNETDINERSKFYIQNLEALKMRGVCMITIGHIFKNDIAFPTEGISPDEKINIGMSWEFSAESNRSLSDIGEVVVKKMLDIGIIVDLTHCAPAGRTRVFEINAGRANPRPLAFTHVGAQKVFEKYAKGAYPNYNYYNVSKEEIIAIEKCGGVIGVIPENFWLTGCDTHIKGVDAKTFKKGIKYIIETMLYINSVTEKKEFDTVAIGTDFDGFADAPKDLYVASQLGDLLKQMGDAGITQQQIKKITHKNAERLLQKGWGKQ
jgi:microsomal dipeptidase-like Zn-dependent dipeptidase